jgi:hypothetical protein
LVFEGLKDRGIKSEPFIFMCFKSFYDFFFG